MANTTYPAKPMARAPKRRLSKIYLNIWDDYWEDDAVPAGQQQKTHAYVEESALTHEEKGLVLRALLRNLETAPDAAGVVCTFVEATRPDDPDDGPHLNLVGLTHVRREALVRDLRKFRLEYLSIPLRIISES